MAIAHPASSEAGSQPESQKKPKSQTETHVDRGTELETASPGAASPVVSDAISHAKRKRPRDLEGGGGAEGGPEAPSVIAGVNEVSKSTSESPESSESSASHLG